MLPPRFTKNRSYCFLCLALTLVSLVAWAVLSNRFSSQAAEVTSNACSAPSFLTAKLVHRFDLAGDIASGDLVSVRPDQDLDEALRVMARYQVRRLPVVEKDGRLVGIFAQADVALEAEPERVGQVVEEISEPPQTH